MLSQLPTREGVLNVESRASMPFYGVTSLCFRTKKEDITLQAVVHVHVHGLTTASPFLLLNSYPHSYRWGGDKAFHTTTPTYECIKHLSYLTSCLSFPLPALSTFQNPTNLIYLSLPYSLLLHFAHPLPPSTELYLNPVMYLSLYLHLTNRFVYHLSFSFNT